DRQVDASDEEGDADADGQDRERGDLTHHRLHVAQGWERVRCQAAQQRCEPDDERAEEDHVGTRPQTCLDHSDTTIPRRRSVRRSRSAGTPMPKRTNSPMNSCCHAVGIPTSTRLEPTTVISRTPSRVPRTLPRPPVTATPPRTTAASTVISTPFSDAGSAVLLIAA